MLQEAASHLNARRPSAALFPQVCSSATLSRLFVPIPQLIDLALELLHIIQDIIRILPRLRPRACQRILRLFPRRIQRILARILIVHGRILIPQRVLARPARAPVVETRMPQIRARSSVLCARPAALRGR